MTRALSRVGFCTSLNPRLPVFRRVRNTSLHAIVFGTRSFEIGNDLIKHYVRTETVILSSGIADQYELLGSRSTGRCIHLVHKALAQHEPMIGDYLP